MEPNLSRLDWRRSSRSGQNGACVEVATYHGRLHLAAAVRDSQDSEGPVLSFRRGEWAAFTQQIKAGAYDL
ncbi:DUF397 domain-containing protein [Actinomadura napierensis]|uniref:DUF397 domain-containing protein n=1 Tax=Actinomadura napierensis TaxID=267854 RepID=A0ABN3AE62_9ACTN